MSAVDFVVAACKGADAQILDHGHVADDPAAFHDLKNAIAHGLFRRLMGNAAAVELISPATISPFSERSSPEIDFSVVDFPAPFGPSRVTI